MNESISTTIDKILQKFKNLPIDQRVIIYNSLSKSLYDFIGIQHPVLNISLVPIEEVIGNTYNPNKVAPPEMKLLELSIIKNGLTMPIVVTKSEKPKEYTIVDGFHRSIICSKKSGIKVSLKGYLPTVNLDIEMEDRIAATVRHNMARGSHKVELSAKLVTLLKNYNWTNNRIGEELGMDPDEVLRLKQISGLAEAFADQDFSKSWK